jgi:hypothetical protein
MAATSAQPREAKAKRTPNQRSDDVEGPAEGLGALAALVEAPVDDLCAVDAGRELLDDGALGRRERQRGVARLVHGDRRQVDLLAGLDIDRTDLVQVDRLELDWESVCTASGAGVTSCTSSGSRVRSSPVTDTTIPNPITTMPSAMAALAASSARSMRRVSRRLLRTRRGDAGGVSTSRAMST